MDPETQVQFTKLVRLRAPLKGKITMLKRYLNRPLDEQIRGELIEKCEALKGLRDKFEQIQTEIESIVTDEGFVEQQQEREDFEEELCCTLAKAKAHISGDKTALLSIQSASLANLSVQLHPIDLASQINHQVNTNETNVATGSQASALLNAGLTGNDSKYRIPKADLPKFEGSYEKWPGFCDTFKSAVHNNSKFSDAEKLMYLRSCLLGKAAEKVESLETTDANYQVAWSILEKYYDDPIAVIDNRIRALFELTPCQNTSALALGEILDNATKHYRALEALNKPFLEAFPIHLVVSKLDHQSRIKWKEEIQGNSSPTMNELLDFLHSRRKVLETHKTNKNEKSDHFNKNILRGTAGHHTLSHRAYLNTENNPISSYATKFQFKPFCHLCKGSHFTQYCEQLVNANTSERISMVKKSNLCFNCLKSNHRVEDCKSSHCKTCNKRHHSLLHFETEKTAQSTHLNTFYSEIIHQNEKLLTTAVVYIKDHRGTYQECRVLLDSCSQPHLLTERMVAKLGLQTLEINVPLGAINSLSSCIKYKTNTTVKSRLNNFSLDLEFLIVREVNELLPSIPIDKSSLILPRNIKLADPSFHSPGPVDGIIGAEYFLQLLKQGQIKIPNQRVILQNTVFGWIVAGKINFPGLPTRISCHLLTTSLNEQLEKFWTIENCPERKILSVEESECENHYTKNTTRDLESGKYCVKLPFKENVVDIGESHSNALKRLYALERTFVRKPELKELYVDNINSYLTNGYMSESNLASTREGYYLPHHAVIKGSSLTTQLRVVFDGSSKSATGLSLNDVLMVGPKIQGNLFSLLVRFRSHAYVLTADIAKMYLQTIVHPDDRKFQKILWRDDPSHPVKTFELNTATFGTSSAPFLAIRSLHQLANDESHLFSRAASILKNDFYVDDMLTGASTREEVLQLRDELIEITRKGGLNLRKWASNDPNLIETLSDCSKEPCFQLNLDTTTKTLGIYWNAKQDSILFTVNQANVSETVTKRIILSQIAQLFDPLGLLGPVTVHAKILMQKLWLLDLGWDAAVPTEIYKAWGEYSDQLSLLSRLKIDRKILIDNYANLQLHGFSDASEKAYGACIYIRSTSLEGKCQTCLVCAKSRVAPLKTITLPRLELSAALLLAQLCRATLQALSLLKFEKIILWSDSTITLHWIKTPPHSLPTFEKNRVSDITTLTRTFQNHEWRHVRSESNPADLISRGLLPRDFINSRLWQNGPEWISKSENLWPKSVLEIVESPQIKQSAISLALNENQMRNLNPEKQITNKVNVKEPVIDIFKHFSSFDELKRFVACCKRVTCNLRTEDRLTGALKINELKNAMITIIKLVQGESFPRELKSLKLKTQVEGKLTNLAPFIDSEGILRVGGRLDKANLQFSQKHPALLPQHHHLTEVLIREEHIKMMHGGTQATLNALYQNYWIVNGRNAVKRILHKCVICARAKPATLQYVMGNLPKDRLSLERPFLVSGVDYCGPFFIKERRHRNRNKIKIYAAIFVCFATKAVHIELVSDLTTEAFLAALRRFFGRRGLSSDLYSDNGTNFVGARNEIEEIQELLSSHKHNERVRQTLLNDHITWHVIPPRSPHFGGLWEAAVKSFKHHILRVVGNTLLTYEEMLTLTTEIESILNSRPLTPISTDPNDLSALTPGHFLIGDSLKSMPEHNVQEIPSGRLTLWQHVQQMRQHFWKRWSKEYLHGLNVKKKWHNGKNSEIKIGNLVTLKEDHSPPMQWILGRIIAVHPGSDNIIRVVTVKTNRGEYKRSVKKIAPLPLETINNV